MLHLCTHIGLPSLPLTYQINPFPILIARSPHWLLCINYYETRTAPLDNKKLNRPETLARRRLPPPQSSRAMWTLAAVPGLPPAPLEYESSPMCDPLKMRPFLSPLFTEWSPNRMLLSSSSSSAECSCKGTGRRRGRRFTKGTVINASNQKHLNLVQVLLVIGPCFGCPLWIHLCKN